MTKKSRWRLIRLIVKSCHKRTCQISARLFNVFKNKAEIARIKFELEYPEPIKPIVGNCQHENTENRIQTDRNGRHMVARQCQDCGKYLSFIRKDKIPDWQNLKEYNQHWNQLWDKYNQWQQQRYEVYREALIEGDDLPMFDEDAFDKEYLANSKVSYREPCNHERSHLTKRPYSNASPHVVEQCLRCGKHLRNVPKKGIISMDELPLFNEELEGKYRLNSSKWRMQYRKEKMEASRQFDERLERAIRVGEFIRQVNSTFNTYYESDDWERIASTFSLEMRTNVRFDHAERQPSVFITSPTTDLDVRMT